jgi:uncharacterized spore protein YtfJ
MHCYFPVPCPGFLFGHKESRAAGTAVDTASRKRRLAPGVGTGVGVGVGVETGTGTGTGTPNVAGAASVASAVLLPADRCRVVHIAELTDWLPDTACTELCEGLMKDTVILLNYKSNASNASPAAAAAAAVSPLQSPLRGRRAQAPASSPAATTTAAAAGFRSPRASKAVSSAFSGAKEDIACLALAARLQAQCCQSKYCSLYYHLLEAFFDNCDRMNPRLRVIFRQLIEPGSGSSMRAFVDLASLYFAAGGVGRGRRYLRLQPPNEEEAETQLRAVQDCLCHTTLSVHGGLRDAKFEYHLKEDLLFNPHLNPNNAASDCSDSPLPGTDQPDTGPGAGAGAGAGVRVRIQATLDIVTDESVYRLRCSSLPGFDRSDFLQLALSAWLWKRSKSVSSQERVFYLFNACTSELWRLDADADALDKVVSRILRHHFRTQGIVSDQSFLEKVQCAAAAAAAETEEINPPARGEGVESLGFVSTAEVLLAKIAAEKKRKEECARVNINAASASDDAHILQRIEELTCRMRELLPAEASESVEQLTDGLPHGTAGTVDIPAAAEETAAAEVGAEVGAEVAAEVIAAEVEAEAEEAIAAAAAAGPVPSVATPAAVAAAVEDGSSVEEFHHNRYWTLQGFDLNAHEIETLLRLDRLALDPSDESLIVNTNTSNVNSYSYSTVHNNVNNKVNGEGFIMPSRLTYDALPY